MGHALIVDDDADTAEMLAEMMASHGFTAATARTIRDARRQLAMTVPDVVFLDLMLPDAKALNCLVTLEHWLTPKSY